VGPGGQNGRLDCDDSTAGRHSARRAPARPAGIRSQATAALRCAVAHGL